VLGSDRFRLLSTFHILALGYFAHEPRFPTTKASNIQLRPFSFFKSSKLLQYVINTHSLKTTDLAKVGHFNQKQHLSAQVTTRNPAFCTACFHYTD